MADLKNPTIESLLDTLESHFSDSANPHQDVSKEIIGLDMVDNTRDRDKPVSIYAQHALDKKISLSDIYDDIQDKEGLNTKGIPTSAHIGVRLNTMIDSINVQNWDSQVQDISTRTNALENWG